MSEKSTGFFDVMIGLDFVWTGNVVEVTIGDWK